jgi:LysR family transcriptional regulator, carnitine catabolism transcriptional activator
MSSRDRIDSAAVSYQQLRAFAAVAYHSSFTRAAEALSTTQSALSARVAQLEQSIGAKLFDRTTRSVHLTRIARDMLPSVERILGDMDALIGQSKDISAGIAGRVVIAALPSVSATILPSAIAAFRTKYPRISIVLRDALAETIVAMLRADEVDFAISSPLIGDRELSFSLLMTDRMAAVFPRGHPLRSVSKLRLEQLADYPTILMDRHSSVRRVIEDALRARGKSLQPVYEVAFMSTAVGFVRAGLGVAVLPTASLEVQSAKDLACRNFTERALTRRIGLLKRRDRSLGPSAESFAAFFTQTCKANGTAAAQ